ncbi:ABC transporter substrate-binding protein [Glutamicibacter sp. BW77]|uniref:ABC transporter substrate-binding protein n=1 Tax=Glutamicibacter sp. BW77 TaxID=2024402 RepID=UPI000BB917A4|nr:ABC transporter substrate-binding protein [Glutamicibacter sp. BW77]PCC36904.1 ABC transporter substrate-binding protein [Glutamicibacter sp. BW77]
MKKRFNILAPMLLIPALGLTACAGSGDPAGTADVSETKTLTVYTSEPQAKIDQIVEAFEKANDGTNVEVFRAATGELKTRIATEKQSGKISADVILAADVPTFETYAAEGTLAKLDISNAAELDKKFVDEEGFWVGTRIIPTIIAYNTGALTEGPASWAALTEETYKSKIAMPNPDVSGAAAFNTAVWFQEAGLGQDWLEKLVANEPTVLESNGPVGQAVAEGSSEVGIVVDYVARELAAKGSPIAVGYPSDGVPYVSQPAGVFADSVNQELANDFVDFLVSKEGQELAVEQSYLPVREDAGVPEGAPALSEINLLDPDQEKIAAGQTEAVDFFNSLLK